MGTKISNKLEISYLIPHSKFIILSFLIGTLNFRLNESIFGSDSLILIYYLSKNNKQLFLGFHTNEKWNPIKVDLSIQCPICLSIRLSDACRSQTLFS